MEVSMLALLDSGDMFMLVRAHGRSAAGEEDAMSGLLYAFVGNDKCY